MELTFIHLADFTRKWDKYRLSDEDLQALEQVLWKNPLAGDVIRGAAGLRKIRFAAPSRHTGKSGAFRVAYGYFQVDSTVYLFTIFAKKDQENLTAAEVIQAKKTMEVLTKYHRKD